MTIRETLSELDVNDKLKVGSHSCYFYVGTVGDFLDGMDDYSAKLRRIFRDDLNDRKAELAAMQSSISLQNYIAAAVAGHTEPSLEGWQKYLTTSFTAIGHRMDKIAVCEQLCDTFVSLRNRKVKEVFHSSIEPGVTAVQIEGFENGKFWSIDEADTLPKIQLTKGNKERKD